MSMVFLVSLKGSTNVGGEIAPLKAKFTQEAFVRRGDEEGDELFFSYRHTSTQIHKCRDLPHLDKPVLRQ